MSKKAIGLRLEEELIEIIKDYSRKYKKLNFTDMCEMLLKFALSKTNSKNSFEIMMNDFMRGEYDEDIQSIKNKEKIPQQENIEKKSTG